MDDSAQLNAPEADTPATRGLSRREWLLLALILVSTLVWRMPFGWERNELLASPDPLYQLQRVVRCMQEYPRVAAFDAYSHFGSGDRLYWPALPAFAGATLAKLAGLSANIESLARVFSWAPPLAGVLALWLLARIGMALPIPRAAPWAGLALAGICGNGFSLFRYGALDHHAATAVAVLLMIWALFEARLWAWATGLFLLLALTPEGHLFGTLLLGLAFLSACVFAGEPRETLREPSTAWRWYLMPTGVCLAAWGMQWLLESPPLPLHTLDWMHLSAFHVVWFLSLGLGFLAASRLPVPEAPPGRRVAWRQLAAGVLVAALLGSLVLAGTGQLRPILDRFLAAGRLAVSEEVSPVGASWSGILPWTRLLVYTAVYAIVIAVMGYRRGASRRLCQAWGIAAILLAFGLREYRYLQVLSPFLTFMVAVAAADLVVWLQARPWFAGPRRAWIPVVAVTALVLAAALHFSLGLRRSSNERSAYSLTLAREVCAWFPANTPDPGPRDGTPVYGVFCPWPMGHHINVLGSRPAVVDPLNVGVEPVLRAVWHAESATAMVEALATTKARYLVVSTPARTILNLPLGDTPPLVTGDASLPPGTPLYLPGMNRFAAFRLYRSWGLAEEFAGVFRPRFYSQKRYGLVAGDGKGQASVHLVPEVQVFELVPGAVLVFADGPANGRVTVTCPMAWSGEQWPFRREATLDTAGRGRLRVALPAPWQESTFAVSAPYRIEAGACVRELCVPPSAIHAGHELRVSLK
ncbi:MAG: hypothetical protein A3K19_28495 [Lentisphaerae bacterium RIFOXYB12_FULL_65_16]|nr:MAG: hypothetical protein A3K18_19745 [Lentisphaerae bacterium RIFOXYA12_64_32]OGV85526.1 MAG: hypothetical protein A3K19_28495 [Lentisphaerae bacterium RIFOXYB12_FULL_65_16]